MGEYADMAVNIGFNSHVDRMFGTRDVTHPEYEEYDESDDTTFIYESSSTRFSIKYKQLVKETEKSWTLLKEDNTTQHYSKKFCELKEGIILVPKWLLLKMRT